MPTFYKLMEQSTLISGTIALCLVATMCYCSVVGLDMPPVLVASLGTVIGYFFSEKSFKTQARIAKAS